jgi:hypothetical protein
MSKNTINRITDVECLRVFGGQKNDETNPDVPDPDTFKNYFSVPKKFLREGYPIQGGGAPVLDNDNIEKEIRECLKNPNCTTTVVYPEDA